MLALPMLVIALAAAEGSAYEPPREARHAPVTGPDKTLSDDEIRARVTNYLGAIDAPITTDQWRALGPRAVPLLETVLANPDELPSRRSAAVGGLAVIGGTRARQLVLTTARSEDEPFSVRAAALHGTPHLLTSRELVRELKPVLEGARTPEARAAAAEVLAHHAPRSSCAAIRAQADREPESRMHYSRALERCGSIP